MAENTTTPRDMVIYNTVAVTTFVEKLQENLDVFNKASQGAIVLDSEMKMGAFSKSSFFKLNGHTEWRDIYSTEKAEHKKIAMGENVSAKIPWMYGPYSTTIEAFNRQGLTTATFAASVGEDAAQAQKEAYIAHAMAALKGALTASSLVVKGSFKTGAPQKALSAGLRKFGDKAQRIRLFVMNSVDAFDFMESSIDNKLYEEAGMVVYGGAPGTLGKAVLVTDECPVGEVYGLVQNAVRVTETQASQFVFYEINDQINLAVGYRGEGNFNIEVLGHSYDVKQGENPKLATLASPATWIKTAESIKSTAGVIVDLKPA